MTMINLIQYIQSTLPALPDSVPNVHEDLSVLKSLPVDELINRFITGIVSLAINLLIAVTVFYIGKFIIRKLYNMVTRIMLRRRVDHSLSTFVLSFVRIVMYFILIVTVIGILGIETSSFLALFASAGVAVGMALSGTLQNFAGGVLILLLKPYRVGDYIEAQGFAGTVKEIQIFATIIVTPDNKSINIPNGSLSTGSVNNYSREMYRRVDWSITISYGDSVDTARGEILRILLGDERVVKQYTDEPIAAVDDLLKDMEEPEEPEVPAKTGFWGRIFKHHKQRVEQWKEKQREEIAALKVRPDRSPVVVVENLGANAVELKVRAWVSTADYWGVYYDMNERFYNELPRCGIHFPFPQLDVHIHGKDA